MLQSAEECTRDADRWSNALQDCAQRQGASATPFRLATVLLTLQGQHDLAADAAQQAALLQPRNAEVALELGTGAMRAGRSEGAMQAFAQAIRLDPKRWRAHVGMARLQAEEGRQDTTEANSWCKHALSSLSDPRSLRLFRRLAAYNVVSRNGTSGRQA